MATMEYQPDPYQGWSVWGAGAGNITAHELMTDTSGRWCVTLDLGFLRIYSSA